MTVINSDKINGRKESRMIVDHDKFHFNQRTYLQMSDTSAGIGERLSLVHPLEYYWNVYVWAIRQKFNIFKQMSARMKDSIADGAILPKWDWHKFSMKTSAADRMNLLKGFDFELLY